jgi:hypothetical protein
MLSYYLGDAAVQTGLPCHSLIAVFRPNDSAPFDGGRAISTECERRKITKGAPSPPFNRLLLSFSNPDLPPILATVFPKAKLRRFDFFEQTRCRILFEGRACRLLNEMAQESLMSSARHNRRGQTLLP